MMTQAVLEDFVLDAETPFWLRGPHLWQVNSKLFYLDNHILLFCFSSFLCGRCGFYLGHVKKFLCNVNWPESIRSPTCCDWLVSAVRSNLSKLSSAAWMTDLKQRNKWGALKEALQSIRASCEAMSFSPPTLWWGHCTALTKPGPGLDSWDYYSY